MAVYWLIEPIPNHMTASPPKIHSAAPVIGTDDIERSLCYYIDVLGFSFDFKYGDPTVYAGVKSDQAEIYFCDSPVQAHIVKENNLAPKIFIWVADAQRLFEEHVDNGAEVFEPIADRPWGARQYVIREINGYHLKFAQPI
jgi:uncharacterized glyoxalase superfamily protein PhnB